MNKPINITAPQEVGIRYVDLIDPKYLPMAKRFYLALKATGESFFLADQIQNHLD